MDCYHGFVTITRRRENAIINLIKVCVGATNVSDLALRQKINVTTTNKKRKVIHITRMWPRRCEELLDGGSLYWVFKGLILARQEILSFKEIIGSDEIKRCGIVLNANIIKTVPKTKRPFQGWRYLNSHEAPKDLDKFSMNQEELPHSLQLELSKLGVY